MLMWNTPQRVQNNPIAHATHPARTLAPPVHLPPGAPFGQTVGVVEGIGERAREGRDGPQRDGHAEEEQAAFGPPLGPPGHFFERLDLLPSLLDHRLQLLRDLLG